MAQEVHRRAAKGALGKVENQAGRPELVENLPEVHHVLLAGLACHQDVVDVDEDEVQAVEDPVHVPLERHPRVLEPEGHPQELEEAEGCDDGGLGHRRLLQGDLQVAVLQIQGAEDCAAFQLAREVTQVGHRVLVGLGGEVEAAEVSAWPPTAVLLLHHVERAAPLAVGPPDDSVPFPGSEDLLGGAQLV